MPRLLSSINQTIDDCDAINSYLESINLYDRFKPFTTLNKEQEELDASLSKKKGRPTVGDDVENDNTATSMEIGNNVSDIKKFNNHICFKCGKEITKEEQILCDECLQVLYEQRVQELIEEVEK